MAVMFTIARKQSQPIGPPTEEQIKRMYENPLLFSFNEKRNEIFQ